MGPPSYMRRMTVTWRPVASCRELPTIRQHLLNRVVSTTATSFPCRHLQPHDLSSRRRLHVAQKCWLTIYHITRCHVSQDRILGYILCLRVSLRANQTTNHAERHPSITNSGKATSYPCQRQCHGLWPNRTGVSVQKFIALKVRLLTSELFNSWHSMNSTSWSNPDCIQKFNDCTQTI